MGEFAILSPYVPPQLAKQGYSADLSVARIWPFLFFALARLESQVDSKLQNLVEGGAWSGSSLEKGEETHALLFRTARFGPGSFRSYLGPVM